MSEKTDCLNIKMIVMDMDGTLLTSKQSISENTMQVLMEAQEKGIRIVLASGRSYRTLLPYGAQLKMSMNDGYFICVNGAGIMETKTMEYKVVRQLQKEEIMELFYAILPFEVEAMGVLDSTIYDYIPDSLREIKREYRALHEIPDDVPWTGGTFSIITDQRKGYSQIYEIQDFEEIPCAVNKICLAHLPDVLEPIHAELIKKYGDKYHFARTSNQWIECSPAGVNKGTAILNLAKNLGIEADEIVVFGDGENDLSMFRVVKYSVAMGNAMDSVKRAAYEVTYDNDSDGIGHFLKKHKVI